MPVEFRCGIGIGKIEVLSSKITEMRGESFCRSHKDYTYSDIARELNVSKQSISKVLNAAHWKAVQKGEQSIRRLLKELRTTSG